MHASLIFCSTTASINVQKIFRIVLAKAFDLKCVIPEIGNVGEPIPLYVSLPATSLFPSCNLALGRSVMTHTTCLYFRSSPCIVFRPLLHKLNLEAVLVFDLPFTVHPHMFPFIPPLRHYSKSNHCLLGLFHIHLRFLFVQLRICMLPKIFLIFT